MEHTKVPKGEESEETKAYSVAEITTMVNALKKEPTAAAVVATAAFTGLRRSELRGLKWGDLRDGQLFVSRSVWNTSERDKTKTKDSCQSRAPRNSSYFGGCWCKIMGGLAWFSARARYKFVRVGRARTDNSSHPSPRGFENHAAVLHQETSRTEGIEEGNEQASTGFKKLEKPNLHHSGLGTNVGTRKSNKTK
jgi:integrase